jgi:SAM-dependent methyltransferase
MKLQNTACPICGSDKHSLYLKSKDIIYGINGLFNIVKCGSCSQLYLNPRPDKSSLSFRTLYPENYVMKSVKFKPNDNSLSAKIHNKYIEDFETKRLSTFEKYINSEESLRLLDVGCGNATFLYFLKKNRPCWNLTGIEFEPQACKGPKELGLNIICGDFQNMEFEKNTYDVITAFHYLEHELSPKEFLIKAKNILKKDGLLVIMVPNIASIEARIFGVFWSGIDVPRHMLFFSQKTLSNLLLSAGFKIIGTDSFFNINGTLISLHSALGSRLMLNPDKYFFLNILATIPAFLFKLALLPFQKDDWITVIARKKDA